jgi:hypothetical protein
MMGYHLSALQDALLRIGGDPLSAAVVDRVAGDATTIATQLQQTVLAEVAEFSSSRNPDLLPELARHAQDHVHEIVRLLRGDAIGSFEFVQQQARRRAEQKFPLEATLHAYRCGHKVLSRWLREATQKIAAPVEDARQAMSAIIDFTMEYTDAISTIFAAAYSSHALLLADVAGDRRSQLLQILLEGHDEADLRVARILRDAGFLDDRQSYCVALARSVDPSEMLNAERARRLADSIEKIVADFSIRHLIDVLANKVIMVFGAVRRDSGWTAPRGSVAQRVADALALVGNAALIGLSNDVPSTAHIPAAHREAATALELAHVGRRVLRFSDIPLQQLLSHFATEEIRRALPAWAGDFYQANNRAQGALIATLRAYAGEDMNILGAAQVLGVHPNTVYARLQRVCDISGLQPRSFHGLTDLLIVSNYSN